MGIGDSIMIASCLAGLMAALPALLLFLNLAFPRTTARAARRLRHGAVTPFFVGLVPVVVLGGPVVGMLALGSVFQLIGVLALLGLFLWAFTGLAGLARLLGERLFGAEHAAARPLVAGAAGAAVLSFALAFPLLGWLLLLPFGLIAGLGATILGRRARYADPPDASTSATPAYDPATAPEPYPAAAYDAPGYAPDAYAETPYHDTPAEVV